MLHFKLSSLGEALLSQHELHSVRKLLMDSERGIIFSIEDAKKAESHLTSMVHNKGIEKMISFFSVLKIMCSSDKRGLLCTENYKRAFDERGNKKMTDIFNYIRENYSKPITLEKVSIIARMSPFAFSRYFKKYAGSGFVEYLNKVRMNKAGHLLRETKYQVHEIAYQCGFSSISNFNKQFRRTEGLAPRDYRARFK
jgi:YesN/AraC family two-component response regulator